MSPQPMSPHGKQPCPHQHRSGYVLVLFAMLLFGIMAMAALVIDIGFARVTQRQMQTAADFAALEGLRFRDHPPPGFEDADDQSRREHANIMVALMYGDELAASINYGASTMAEFAPGIIDENLYASQHMTIPDQPVYMPTRQSGLQLNLDNLPGGDMAAGRYHAEPAADASAADVRDFHKERSDYTRADFEPGVSSDAFLVRLRRTGETFDIASSSSSAGPQLPYLFGRGSLLPRKNIGEGIRVRATAIANAQPAVTVGPDLWSYQVPGAIRIAVRESIWKSWPLDDDDDATDQRVPLNLDGEEIGAVTVARMIGQQVTLSDALPPMPPTIQGYVAIFDSIHSVERVIGFGAVHIEDLGNDPPSLMLRKLVREALPQGSIGENASSRLSDAWNSLTELAETDRSEVIERNRSLIHPLLAPVSVR